MSEKQKRAIGRKVKVRRMRGTEILLVQRTRDSVKTGYRPIGWKGKPRVGLRVQNRRDGGETIYNQYKGSKSKVGPKGVRPLITEEVPGGTGWGSKDVLSSWTYLPMDTRKGKKEKGISKGGFHHFNLKLVAVSIEVECWGVATVPYRKREKEQTEPETKETENAPYTFTRFSRGNERPKLFFQNVKNW